MPSFGQWTTTSFPGRKGVKLLYPSFRTRFSHIPNQKYYINAIICSEYFLQFPQFPIIHRTILLYLKHKIVETVWLGHRPSTVVSLSSSPSLLSSPGHLSRQHFLPPPTPFSSFFPSQERVIFLQAAQKNVKSKKCPDLCPTYPKYAFPDPVKKYLYLTVCLGI